jgi:hypothetical protein
MIRALISLSLLALSPALSHAHPVTAETVEAVLADHGVTDITFYPDEGDSIGSLEGLYPDLDVGFSVRLLRCEDGPDCFTALFFANFDLERTPEASDYFDMNSYNDTYPFGRAYVYEDEDGTAAIGVDYVVDLEDENVFGDNEVATFGVILSSFIDHMVALSDAQ